MPGVTNEMPQADGATGSAQQPAQAPSGTPSGSEQPASGEIEIAKANVSISIKILEKALPIIGAESDEGKALLSALSTLSKKFSGSKSEDLAPAELMNVMAGMPDSYKQAMMQGNQPAQT